MVTFLPATASATVQTGNSADITLRATAANPALLGGGVLYVVVEDRAQVLLPQAQINPLDDTSVAATLHTSPTLGAGRYQGTLQVHLCRDAQCSTELAGSPLPLPYDITVTPEPLVASVGASTGAFVSQGGSVSSVVPVSVSGPALVAWTASTTTSWLAVQGGTGSGSGGFSVAFQSTSTLAPGTYEGLVTVLAGDGQRALVSFVLDVRPTQFSLNGEVPLFAAVNGATITGQTLGFALDNGQSSSWNAAVSVPWLLATPGSGTALPGAVLLTPDPSLAQLASGSYSADVVLSTPGGVTRTLRTQLVLSTPVLSSGLSTVVKLGGPRGRDLLAPQTLPISLNTGDNSWPYSLSTLPNWVSSSTINGLVNQSGTPLSFTPVLAGITPGTASATVTVSAAVNGDRISLPLTVLINADQRRLLPSAWAVGLSSTPAGVLLSRSLSVRDNYGGTLSWTASSDAPWLSVTGAGTTTPGNATDLLLAADPSLMPADTLLLAKVTLNGPFSAGGGVEAAVVRVAGWKSASGLIDLTALDPAVLAAAASGQARLAADPLRPWIYVHGGGADIDVYHLHTGLKVASLSGVAAALGEMSVSPDGSRLYALDTANRTLVVIDLDNFPSQPVTTWPLFNAVDRNTALLAVRPNGVELVLVGDGSVYRNGVHIADTRILGVGGPLVATADGRTLFNLAAAYDLDYSAMLGGSVFSGDPAFLSYPATGGNPKDVAVSPDGSRIYVADAAGLDVPGRYFCAALDASRSFVGALPGGSNFPNNVAVTWDGRVVCGAISTIGGVDIWLHSPAGAQVAAYRSGVDLADRQVQASADGMMLAALGSSAVGASAARLVLLPIGR